MNANEFFEVVRSCTAEDTVERILETLPKICKDKSPEVCFNCMHNYCPLYEEALDAVAQVQTSAELNLENQEG